MELPPPVGPDQLPNFYHAILTFERPETTTTTTKVVNFLGEEKCTPWENPGYAYENRAPALRWYGAPEWLIMALRAGGYGMGVRMQCRIKLLGGGPCAKRRWGALSPVTP